MTDREVSILRRAAADLRAQGDDEAAEELEWAWREVQREQLPYRVRAILADVQSEQRTMARPAPPPSRPRSRS